VLDELTKELALRLGLKHDSPGAPTTIGYAHGPGGILAFPGVDPVLFHTVMGPYSLLGRLPAVGSPYMNPTYATLTGVTDSTGTEPDAICDPGVRSLVSKERRSAVRGNQDNGAIGCRNRAYHPKRHTTCQLENQILDAADHEDRRPDQDAKEQEQVHQARLGSSALHASSSSLTASTDT